MKLFLLERNDDTTMKYEIYLSCVVCAKDKEDAKRFHPEGETLAKIRKRDGICFNWPLDENQITATEIGGAKKEIKRGTIICSSFYNA